MIMEDSKNLFCSSKFPCERGSVSSKFIDTLTARPQKSSPALPCGKYRCRSRADPQISSSDALEPTFFVTMSETWDVKLFEIKVPYLFIDYCLSDFSLCVCVCVCVVCVVWCVYCVCGVCVCGVCVCVWCVFVCVCVCVPPMSQTALPLHTVREFSPLTSSNGSRFPFRRKTTSLKEYNFLFNLGCVFFWKFPI